MTEFNNIFLGKLVSRCENSQSLRDCLCPHLQGVTDDLTQCCLVYIPVSDLGIGMECEPSDGSQETDKLYLGYLLMAV